MGPWSRGAGSVMIWSALTQPSRSRPDSERATATRCGRAWSSGGGTLVIGHTITVPDRA